MKKGLLVISSLLAITLLAGCRGRGRGGNSGSTSGNDNSNSSGQVSNSASVSNSGSAVSNSSSKSKANTTILIYMCGSDLESGQYNFASTDIEEIISVNGQPDDVNIVIETGGANINNSYFSTSKIQRWHVANKKMVKDAQIAKTNMSASSTLQDFLEYGLTNFPAEKTGVILWDHGAGQAGACYDELSSSGFSYDYLTNSETKTAFSNVFTKLNITTKLEWIGYDCCLMQTQDYAEFNSQFFNYMIASEEAEAGYGWDYDTWLDDLYAKKQTEQVLTAIVDGFIADNGGASITEYQGETADQALSWLNLNNMSEYKTAFENLATQLKSKITSSNKSSWLTLMGNVKTFAQSDYAYFGMLDVKDFVNKLAANSTFKPDTSYTNAVLTAFNNLVGYNVAQAGAGNAYGLSMYYDIEGEADRSSVYTSSETNFTNWKYIVDTYPGTSSGGGWGGYGGY